MWVLNIVQCTKLKVDLTLRLTRTLGNKKNKSLFKSAFVALHVFLLDYFLSKNKRHCTCTVNKI